MRYSNNIREGGYFLRSIVCQSPVHQRGAGQLVGDVEVVGVV